MSTIVDANIQGSYAVKLQKGVRHNMVKIFKCPQCGVTFDRASQLGYHYRSIHLGERSQICQICGKGFFRKTDLRTHLNVHLGTNFCICEFCGRKFNHISNLIRHCRVHAGVKPYLCSICDRRFTQVSSLVRHKQIIHGIPKETMRQYCNSSHVSNKPQLTVHTSKENEMKDNNIKNNYHVKSKCQNTSKEPDVSAEKVIANHNTNTDNTSVTTCLPFQTVIYVSSKQFEQDHSTEIESRLSQEPLAEVKEKLESVNPSTTKAAANFQSQGTNDNHEQSKDNIIYLHQFDRNSFTFLPRDRGPNSEPQIQNNENTVKSSDAEMRATRLSKSTSANDTKQSLNVETKPQTCNPDEIISEVRKCDKLFNDDNQLYIELSELGLLKFDESRYNNTDSIGFNHVEKSQYSADIAADDLAYILAATQSRDGLSYNEDSAENLDNVNNIVLNEEPMLRLVQTETGELFYELIISDLVEKMQSTARVENTKNEMGRAPSSTFEHCQRTDPQNTEQTSDRTEHQQALEDLTDMNSEFNYTQFDLHGEEKNFAVLCDSESEHFQQGSRENECVAGVQEKSLQVYDGGNLELLENESHVDFEKYVETNFEVFERLNYENCSEKLLELVEVADIGVEPSGCKESSAVCLIQNDGDQLLELLQDCEITEQETDFVSSSDLRDEDCSNALQHSDDRVTVCTESKSDFFEYVEKNVSLQNSVNSDRSPNNNNHVYANLIANNAVSVSDDGRSNENRAGTSNQLKKPEKPKTSLKKFQCSVCKKTFSTAYNYKQHIGIHFTDQQKFHCKECGASFAWKSTLNKHVASNHSSDEPQKYACEICTRSYNTFSQVNEHVKRDHLKQRNHVCPHCGKSFFKSFDLKTHSRTHTNERPYVCPVCGKRFHHQSHIIRHERTHSGERPYACDICQKTFMQPSSLKTHKQKHRQVKINALDYQVDEDDPVALMTL